MGIYQKNTLLIINNQWYENDQFLANSDRSFPFIPN
jgi:hypothetical protein